MIVEENYYSTLKTWHYLEYISIPFIFILAFFITRLIFCRRRLIESNNLAVFISGCDTGLGNRLAVYFDSIGCDVYAGCLNPNSRNILPKSVNVIPLDITKENSVKDAVDQLKMNLKQKGKDLWALINNAGVCVYGEFEWQTWNQCQKQVEVNFLGTMRLTKAIIPLLRKMKGRIITITSVNGSIAYPGLSVYCATKFALEGLFHSLRLELSRQHGIKVILIQPGDFARLTNIMSQHEKNAQEMWENMSPADQENYGDFFHLYQRVTMKNYGLTSPKSLEDSPLLTDTTDALLNTNPKIRYISASVKYRLFYHILGLAPFCIVDAFLRKVSEMLFKSDEKER